MSIFSSLTELERENKAGALCMVVRSQGSTPRGVGSKMLVYPDGSIVGTVGGGELENRVIESACEAIMDGKPRMLEYNMSDPARGDPGVCGGTIEIFVEPLLPEPTLVVIGGGHVGKAVVYLAHWLGFRVVVNDDRAGFCTPDANPDADVYIHSSISDLPSELNITPWTYLVLTTRGTNVDVEGVPALLETPAAYIGVIGSKRRWATAYKQMLEAGVSKEKLDQIRSPIGLELQAETPEEIAVSILAEIIMLRRGGDGGTMSEK